MDGTYLHLHLQNIEPFTASVTQSSQKNGPNLKKHTFKISKVLSLEGEMVYMEMEKKVSLEASRKTVHFSQNGKCSGF